MEVLLAEKSFFCVLFPSSGSAVERLVEVMNLDYLTVKGGLNKSSVLLLTKKIIVHSWIRYDTYKHISAIPFISKNIEVRHHRHKIALVQILGFHSKRQVRLSIYTYNVTNETQYVRAPMTLIGYRPILQHLESDGQILCSLKKKIAECQLLL